MPRTKLDKKKTEVTQREYPEIMDLAQVMSFLRVSYGTAVKLLTTEIPSRHLNRYWRVYKQDVIDWVRKGQTISITQAPDKLTVEQAAKIMGVTPMFLRLCLRDKEFPFGTAIKGRDRWIYYINAERFRAYMEARDLEAEDKGEG